MTHCELAVQISASKSKYYRELMRFENSLFSRFYMKIEKALLFSKNIQTFWTEFICFGILKSWKLNFHQICFWFGNNSRFSEFQPRFCMENWIDREFRGIRLIYYFNDSLEFEINWIFHTKSPLNFQKS
jgi:hypothetical protein